MTKKDFIKLLKKNKACEDAIKWCAETTGSPQQLWEKCDRGDWMLWLIAEFSGEPESLKRRKLALTCVKCAKTAYKYVDDKDKEVHIDV